MVRLCREKMVSCHFCEEEESKKSIWNGIRIQNDETEKWNKLIGNAS